jgi:hypothetical protein
MQRAPSFRLHSVDSFAFAPSTPGFTCEFNVYDPDLSVNPLAAWLSIRRMAEAWSSWCDVARDEPVVGNQFKIQEGTYARQEHED